MPNSTVAWFHSLSDSVASLGIAARELRAARQGAQLISWHIDPMRLLSVDGAVSVPGRHYVRPHDHAISKLSDLYSALEISTKALYKNTALAYAYGTAQAVVAVLNSERPTHVQLERRDDGYVPAAVMLPDLQGALGQWAGSQEMALLRNKVIDGERATALVDEYSFYEDLADYECIEMAEASATAEGLADSAYVYGVAAESALHFLLITARTSDI
ncbi:hypothetical protein ACWF94_10205 [Streptomyces sp. NPDC055078]